MRVIFWEWNRNYKYKNIYGLDPALMESGNRERKENQGTQCIILPLWNQASECPVRLGAEARKCTKLEVKKAWVWDPTFPVLAMCIT